MSTPVKSHEFRHELLEMQDIATTPALREAYQNRLDAILHEPLTPSKRAVGIALLILMVALVVAEVWAMIHYPASIILYGAATTMLVACGLTALWIARDLGKQKVSRRSSYKVSEMFYGVAGLLIAMQLIHGLRAPSDPASTFGVLYLFVFLFVCGAWSLANRIRGVELAAREQTLRIELRLADLAERLQH